MLCAFDVSFEILNSESELQVLFQGLNITVDPGKIIGLIGQSATGKSTIANLMAGFLVPSAGEIRCENEQVSQPNSPVSLVHQEYKSAVFSWMRARDYIESGRYKGMNAEDGNILSTTQIADLLEINYLDKYPAEMSGGQIQRVQLGRAIRSGSKYLILDEPTSSLDLRFREDLMSILKILAKDYHIGIMFISHQLGEVIFASDRVYYAKKDLNKLVHVRELEGFKMKTPNMAAAQRETEYINAYGEAYDYIF